jgi:hypothetical protein
MFHKLLTALAFAAALGAAPITVTEPPDFPGAAGPVYNLGAGVNTISGSVSGCPGCGGDYQDNFTVVLPSGFTLISGFFSATYNSGGGSNPQLACASGQGCFGAGLFSGIGSGNFTNGQYAITVTSPYSTLSVETPGSSSYTFSFTVTGDGPSRSEVPEPSTWALLGAGLAAIGLLRRHQ